MASAPAAAAPASDINDKELRDSFSKIDTDRSGKISRAEIAAFFRRHGTSSHPYYIMQAMHCQQSYERLIGRRVEEKEIDDAINFADTNKDGQVVTLLFLSYRFILSI